MAHTRSIPATIEPCKAKCCLVVCGVQFVLASYRKAIASTNSSSGLIWRGHVKGGQAGCVEGIIRFNLIGQSPPNFLPQLVLNFLPFWQLLNDTRTNDEHQLIGEGCVINSELLAMGFFPRKSLSN